MKIGFALITAAPFFNDIVTLENKLNEASGFHNKLECIHNIPHTTLFQGSFSNDTDYVSIADELVSFFKTNCKDKFLHFNKVVYVPYGWYFYLCNATEELKALHNLTLEKCKPHIVLEPDRMERNLSGLTNDQLEGIRQYGYRYSGNAFFPHITLGRTSLDMQPEIITSFSDGLAFLPKNVPIERLTVYKMGPDGMHAETLYEQSLL